MQNLAKRVWQLLVKKFMEELPFLIVALVVKGYQKIKGKFFNGKQ